jgi:hypothetical protein
MPGRSQPTVVYRNGIEIGRARLTVNDDAPLVNHALMFTPVDFAARPQSPWTQEPLS